MKVLLSMSRYILLVISVAAIYACSKDDERLSCDPVVNDWAKHNVSTYENISRTDFVKFSLSEQRAIYNGVSGARKVQFWREKLDIISEQNLLSSEELEVFKEIVEYMNPNHFDNPYETEDLMTHSQNCVEKLIKEHGWDDEKVFYYTHTWLTKEEYIDAYLFEKLAETKSGLQDSIIGGGGTRNCECKRSFFGCPALGICTDGNCTEVKGCGLLGGEECTGRCD